MPWTRIGVAAARSAVEALEAFRSLRSDGPPPGDPSGPAHLCVALENPGTPTAGRSSATTPQCTFYGFDVLFTLVHTAVNLSFLAGKQGVGRLVMEIEKHSCSGLSYHSVIHLPY